MVKIIRFRIKKYSAVNTPLIIKLHPNDSQYIIWVAIFKVLLFGINLQILTRDSTVPSSCTFLSVGSYYGFSLYCTDQKVYFLTSSYPTFLDPVNDQI